MRVEIGGCNILAFIVINDSLRDIDKFQVCNKCVEAPTSIWHVSSLTMLLLIWQLIIIGDFYRNRSFISCVRYSSSFLMPKCVYKG